MTTSPSPLTLYCVRDSRGLYSAFRDEWVEDLAKARFYFTPGPARSIVTRLTKDCLPGEVGSPLSILSWVIDPGAATVLDDTPRARRAVTSIKATELRRTQRSNRERLDSLVAQQDRVGAELRELRRITHGERNT